MAGLLEPGLFRSAHRAVDMENMSWAAAQADVQGITILIEPINGRDMPGYFVHRQDQAHVKLREQMPGIGHIQVAGVPDRHEPDEGELNYPIFSDYSMNSGMAGGSAANTGLVQELAPALVGCGHGYNAVALT
jgi:hydroxypyruvate isomerase